MVTEQEELELNKQLKRWQDKQLRIIQREKFEEYKMSDIELSIWTRIANAESYKEISNGCWNVAEKIIETINLLTYRKRK
ncbi:MAG: hypothetical protein PHY47_26845 [Lachnospiraceae bacterium]|nr:hypothetical protein [Lachnospiraceae bacterium]